MKLEIATSILEEIRQRVRAALVSTYEEDMSVERKVNEILDAVTAVRSGRQADVFCLAKDLVRASRIVNAARDLRAVVGDELLRAKLLALYEAVDEVEC